MREKDVNIKNVKILNQKVATSLSNLGSLNVIVFV